MSIAKNIDFSVIKIEKTRKKLISLQQLISLQSAKSTRATRVPVLERNITECYVAYMNLEVKSNIEKNKSIQLVFKVMLHLEM